eukprot:7579075-Lingulodinium_polyedra.AAC.1
MVPSRRFGQSERTSGGKSTSRHKMPGMTPLKMSTTNLTAIGDPPLRRNGWCLRRLDALF